MSGGFLGRWSRLKRGAAEARPAPPAPEPPASELSAPELPAPDLPAVETLDRDSDYAPFLADGVSPELRRAALRKLWASDPALAAPEVLDLHAADYSFPSIPEVVATAWRVGKGFIDEAEAVAERVEEAMDGPAPPGGEGGAG